MIPPVTLEAKKIKNVRVLCWFLAFYFTIAVLSDGERAIFLHLLNAAIGLFIAFCIPPLRFWIIQRRAGVLSFDDEAQKIITGRKHAISYDKIKIIKIVKTEHILRIDAILYGFMKRNILLFLTDIKDEETIIQEIKKRFKDEKIRIKNRSTKKLLFVIFAILISLNLLVIFYLYQKFPYLKIFPIAYIQKSETIDLREMNAYSFQGFNFNLPKEFQQKKKEGTEEDMMFFSEKQKVAIAVSSQNYAAKFLSGRRDVYEQYRTVYYSRLGFRTLRMKMILLTAGGNIERIYEVHKNSLRGFLELEKRDKVFEKAIAELFLEDKTTHKIIRFTIYSQEIDFKLIDILLNGVSVKENKS